MNSGLQMLAQEGDGANWTSLLYLVIFLVLPLMNKVKDKYIEWSQGTQPEKGRTAPPERPVRIPNLRPTDQAVPPAEAFKKMRAKLETAAQAASAAAKHAGPQIKPSVHGPPAPPKPVARKRPPAEGQAQEHRLAELAAQIQVIESEPTPATPQGAKPMPPAERRVDIHDADLHVNLAANRPAISAHEMSTQRAVIDSEIARPSHSFEGLSADQMRQAVLLSEILRPPLALRPSAESFGISG